MFVHLTDGGGASCSASSGPRRSPSWRDDLDQWREASKIRFIEGQQPAFAMRQHGRDDIGVMDLTTSKRNSDGSVP